MLADLQAAGKPTEIQQAQANLADAQAARTQSQVDLQRAQTLLPQGAATQQNVDQLRATYLSNDAKVQVAEAALAQAQAPQGRDEAIKAQMQAVQAAQAAVDMAQWRLDQRTVTAPDAGRIADVIALPGEVVNAGMPVVSLLPPQNIFVRFFVPEPDLSAIHYGDKVALKCDGCPAGLAATVSFISPQSEYTPPVIYSESSSSKLVYLVEARMPPDEAEKFNPGQPIEVRPIASGAQP
jgi:HlyD family secretion protein